MTISQRISRSSCMFSTDIAICNYSQCKQNPINEKKKKETLPFCRNFTAVVFPLNVFPNKHPLMANEGNSGSADSTWGGRDFSTSLRITWPNMQLLEGGKLSTISSGKAHSPTMFCKNNNETNKTKYP